MRKAKKPQGPKPNRAAGGHARMKATTPQQRAEWARKAATNRRRAELDKWGLLPPEAAGCRRHPRAEHTYR